MSDLIARIPKVARGKSGIGAEERALAKKILPYGPRAVPYLLPLLKSDKPGTAELTGFILSDIDGLTERDLDALTEARLRGNGWVPRAIGRIGTPRAIRLLIEDLEKDPEPASNSQVVFALVAAGGKAAVPLAKRFADSKPIGHALSSGIGHIFREMGESAASAVDPLIAIVVDRAGNLQNRKDAAVALGCIGPVARRAVPALKRLTAADPTDFADAVEAAIVEMRVPEAAPIHVARLRKKPDMRALRDLAELGENGREAGPVLVDLLASHDPEIRVGAARALGFIGYAGSEIPLTKVLDDPDDWRLPYVAAESLGRLHARRAVPGLEKLAAGHWYPPVRQAARSAIERIRAKDRKDTREPRSNFAFEFFAYEDVGVREPVNRRPGKPGETLPAFVKAVDQLNAAELATLSYDVEIIGYDADGRHVTRTKSRPDCGLKLPGGYLLGSDRGEWGGELVFLDDKSRATRLIVKNTRGVYRMPFGIVAVCGLAHLTINDGALFLVAVPPRGEPRASLWKSLPGAPSRSGMLSDGNLYIACQGGDIVVTPDGRMMMADQSSKR